MDNAEHTPPPWIVGYDTSPCVALPGWQIKSGAEPYTPIAVVAEPSGGRKGKDGRSPYQAANARLIGASPELYESLLHMRLCASCSQGAWDECDGGRAALAAIAKVEGKEAVTHGA
jgi:hypothetical protein